MRFVLAPLLASLTLFAPCIASAAVTDDTVQPRLTITPRIGLGFPGQATARKISRTELGVGFVMHHDAMIAIGDHFEIGPSRRRSSGATTSRVALRSAFS